MDDEKEVQVSEENQAADDSSQDAKIASEGEEQAADNAAEDSADVSAEAESPPEEGDDADMPDISEGVDPVPESAADEAGSEEAEDSNADAAPVDTGGEADVPEGEAAEAEAEAPSEDAGEEKADGGNQEENPDFSDDEVASMTDEEKAMLMSMDDVPEESSGEAEESIGSNGLLSQEDLDAAMQDAGADSQSGSGGLFDSAEIPQENEGKSSVGSVPSSSSGGQQASAPPEPETPVNSAEFQQLSPASKGKEGPRNIDLLMDVDLPVSIELGRTRMNISDILALGPGSVVELEKLVGEPVDLLVNQKTVARGEVVVVEENFGLRITELVSAEERIKNL